MTRIHFILLFLLISALCNAQAIEKRYSSHLSNTGIVNFFLPKKLKKNTNIDMFRFDMTYISYSDSVTLNCTYRIRNRNNIKTFNLKSNNNSIHGEDFSVIYREVRKHGYEVRVTSRFSFNDIKNVFNNHTPLHFEIVLNDNSSYMASYRKSAWKKESFNVTRILESINY